MRWRINQELQYFRVQLVMKQNDRIITNKNNKEKTDNEKGRDARKLKIPYRGNDEEMDQEAFASEIEDQLASL